MGVWTKILWCYHSNETSSAVFSHGAIHLVCSFQLLSLLTKPHGFTILSETSLYCKHEANTEFYLLSPPRRNSPFVEGVHFVADPVS